MANHKVIITWASIGVVLTTAAYIIINKIKKGKEVDDIYRILDAGVGSTGTAYGDLGGNKAFDRNFWKNLKGSILTMASARAMAAKIKSDTGIIANETDLLNVFKSLKSKMQVSFLSSVYYDTYKRDMLDDIKTIDNTLLGLNIGHQYLPEIQQIVNNLPDNIAAE